jgi:hypothetical protein
MWKDEKMEEVDPKELFAYFKKYMEQARAHRMYVLDTGRGFTKQAFSASLWKYMITHPEESRPLITELLGEKGIVMTENLWKSYLVVKSRFFLTVGSKNRFLRDNGVEGFEPEEIYDL